MKRILLIFIITLFFNVDKATNTHIIIQDQSIINDLILIKNTYNWVNDSKVRFDMIRRQNILVSINERYLYEEYLINE